MSSEFDNNFLEGHETRRMQQHPATAYLKAKNTQRETERKKTVLSQVDNAKRSAPRAPFNPDQYDWDKAVTNGEDFASGYNPANLKPEAPERYVLGVDTATMQEVDTKQTLFDHLGDGITQAVAGAARAGVNAFEKLSHLRDLGDEKLASLMSSIIPSPHNGQKDGRVAQMIKSGELQGRAEDVTWDQYLAAERLNEARNIEAVRDWLPDPKTMTGRFTGPMAQFLVGFIPAFRGLRASGLSAVGANVIGSAGTSAVVWEHGEDNLSNFLTEFNHPALNNAVTQFLSADPNDSRTMDAAKKAIEDVTITMGAGAIAQPFVQVMRGIQHARLAKSSELYKTGLDNLQRIQKQGKFRYRVPGSPGAQKGQAGPDAQPKTVTVEDMVNDEEATAFSYMLAGKIGQRGEGMNYGEWHAEAKKMGWDGGRIKATWATAHELFADTFKYNRSSTNGQYIGAPKGIDSPQALEGLRRRMTSLAREGINRGDHEWYKKSSQALSEMFGGDVEETERFVQLVALYSPQREVEVNFNLASRAYYQFMAGEPIKVGTGRQDKTASELLYDGKQFGGAKINPFYTNLMQELDPSFTGGSTFDIWMARAIGGDDFYTGTSSQSKFGQAVVRDVSKRVGLNEQQTQAAMWVARKAQGTEAFWKQKGMHRDLTPEQRKANATTHAQKNYKTGRDQIMGQVSAEYVPGATSQHLQGIDGASFAQKQEYHNAVGAIFQDDKGRDAIAVALKLPVKGNIKAPGSFQGKVSPGVQFEVPMPHAGLNADGKLDPAATKMMDVYSAIRGLLTYQDAMAYHRPFYGAQAKSSNGFDLDVGKALTPEEMKAVQARVEQFTNDPEVGIVATGNGVRVLNFSQDNGKFQEAMQKAFVETSGGDLLDPPLFPDATGRRFKSDGNFIENDWRQYPNGEKYREIIEKAGYGEALAKLEREYAPQIEAVSSEFSTKYGWGPTHRQATMPGSMDVKGTHYGKQGGLKALSGAHHGTGIKGAEGKRRAAHPDKYVASRSYFYKNDGQDGLPRKEAGLGQHVYEADLRGVYDLKTDPRGLVAQAREEAQSNNPSGFTLNPETGKMEPIKGSSAAVDSDLLLNILESTIKDLGYNGYASGQAIVSLADETPVNYLGPENELKGATK